MKFASKKFSRAGNAAEKFIPRADDRVSARQLMKETLDMDKGWGRGKIAPP